MDKDIIVTVLIVTYNHEEYIEDAIRGVLNQKTEYRYEILIHDDASTDGTRSIIERYQKKYSGIIKTNFHLENLFDKGMSATAIDYEKIAGKYIALCDGDDYWTDAEKLQKQIEFLEDHPEYSMCIHNAEKFNCKTGEKKLLNTFPKSGTYDQKSQILAGIGTNFPASASYVMRRDLLTKIPAFFLKPRALDYSLRQYLASKGKVYYFEDVMSVYRVMTRNSYMKETTENREFYNDYTIEMLKFFEEFNIYTDGKYQDIIQNKLNSDYYGYCSSVDEMQGLKKAEKYRLDREKIKKCYLQLNTEYLNPKIKELCEHSANIYIYGTSRIAAVCQKQLDFAGIKYEGFVVSDGQQKADDINGWPVYWLGEVKKKHVDAGFILAVQPVNLLTIESYLKSNKIKNYCTPYMLC